jgi:hypothetical protein
MNDNERGERKMVFLSAISASVFLSRVVTISSVAELGGANQASRLIISMMNNAVRSALLTALRALKQFSRGRVKASCEKIAKLTLRDEARSARGACHSEVC